MNPDLNVTTGQLMQILGVTRRMITYYVQRGMPKEMRSRFDLTKCIPWLLANAKHIGSEALSEGTREELYAAQTTTHKLQHAKMRSELVPYDEAAGVLWEVCQIIIGGMDGLAPRLGGVVANMDNPAEIEQTIEHEIRTCRELAAQRIREYESKHHYGGGYRDATATEERSGVGEQSPDFAPRKSGAWTLAQ